MPSNFLTIARRWLVAGLLVLFLFSRASAQSAPPERWLFVFDTSVAMKKFLPSVELETKNLLASAVGEQLHEGDSMGVWTFGREMHSGQFPLVTWNPEEASATASNIIAFVHKQSYVGETSWDSLQPLLGQVIKNSARLTVVIFCDGDGQINWTPYNEGINQTFSQSLAERKKAHQPFVLLVRTQHGQFVGCTVNFPPGALNVPPFPALPEPVEIISTNPPPTEPVMAKPLPVVVPSLFIVGTNVGTNFSDLSKIPAPATNLSAPPIQPTNVLSESNHLAVAVLSDSPTAPSNTKSMEAKVFPATTTADDTDHGSRTLTYVGVGFFAAAVGLMIYLWARSMRRPRGSLITISMQNDSRPPPRK